MAITDIAGNPLAPATVGQVIGFIEVTAEEALTLRIYNFLLKPIRDADATDGNLFVKRLLDGPQDVWATTQSKIFAIKDLWSVTEIPDEFLQYLKNIVGWTKELITKRVTDVLTPDELRRLISISVPFWKTRGPEDTILNILSALTGQRSRIWNWFDFRWVLDETAITEEHQGRDPWVIELPGDGDDEYRLNVRIVDPVVPVPLNRDLVIDLLKLTRPAGERFEVSYIDFLDRFLVIGDDGQWTLAVGTSLVVSGGNLKLADSSLLEEATLSPIAVPNASNWSGGIVAYVRLRATTGSGQIGVYLYRVDALNYYEFTVSVGTFPTVADVQVRKVVAGVPTIIYGPTPLVQAIGLNVWTGLRANIEPGGGTNIIKMYLDGDEVVSFADSTFTGGGLSVFHGAGIDLEVDEVEVFQTPLVTDTIDINTV